MVDVCVVWVEKVGVINVFCGDWIVCIVVCVFFIGDVFVEIVSGE